MPRFAVLLRGVNVGKGNRLPMAEFRVLLEGLGCTGVKTLLNSGNAVFSAAGRSTARHAEAIGAAVQARFGFSVPVVVHTAAELAAIVAGNTLAPVEAEHARFLVVFTMAPDRLQALNALRPLLHPGEALLITSQAAYLHCAGGLLESRVGEALLGKAGRGVTTRNWATVLKLAGLLAEPPRPLAA